MNNVVPSTTVVRQSKLRIEKWKRLFVGAEPAGERRLAREVLALVRAARGAVGHEPHALELDADVRHHEGDGLPMADRLAERDAFVDVRNHVVEHRLRGANRQRAPAEA